MGKRGPRQLRRPRRPGPRAYVLTAAVGVVAVLAVGAIVVTSSSASLTPGTRALASVRLPLGGGRIESVLVTGGPHAAPIPVELRGTSIWPRGRIAAGERVSIEVVVKRPGLVSWLTGSSEHVQLTVRTPTTVLRNPYLTVASGAPLSLHFSQPVQRIAYGQVGALTREYLSLIHI